MLSFKLASLGAALLLSAAAVAASPAIDQPPVVQAELHETFDVSTGDIETFESAQVAYCVSGFNAPCRQQPSAGCNCPACAAKKAGAPKPCATSHNGLFFDNDFSYLKDPSYQGHCLGDCLKLMPVDRCGRFGALDIGGQLRLRYHHEQGMGQQAGATRFENTTNDFLLTRLRLYTNWQATENVRFYMENIFAYVTADAAYIPRPIDQNFGDFLNLFADIKLTEGNTLRVGRQELLYGAQRTVSPLDWANTRRTFEGVKLMNRTGDWATDLFYTNFVPPSPTSLISPTTT